MADYIKRSEIEAVYAEMCKECRESCMKFDGFFPDCDECFSKEYRDKVLTIPSADVAPVTRGVWKKYDDGWGGEYYECSSCNEPFCLIEGTPSENMYNFCPNCGAKMDGET